MAGHRDCGKQMRLWRQMRLWKTDGIMELDEAVEIDKVTEIDEATGLQKEDNGKWQKAFIRIGKWQGRLLP